MNEAHLVRWALLHTPEGGPTEALSTHDTMEEAYAAMPSFVPGHTYLVWAIIPEAAWAEPLVWPKGCA